MENYKLINVQLMNQVQSQRIMIRQLREEEVKLRRSWMEEREKRLADGIFYENKLKCAIRTLLSSLGINLDFNANSVSPPASQASGSEDNRSNRSNSNRISSEFRASSVLLQNSVPMSPSNRNRGPSVRRSSVNALDDCSSEVTNNPSDAGEEIIHLETPEPRHLHELQGYTSSPSSPEAEGTQEDQTLRSPAMTSGFINSILDEYEESEALEVSEDQVESEVTTLSSTIEHVETQQKRIITKKTSPLVLRDLTNNSTRLNSSSNITKAAFISQNDTENDFQETVIARVRRGPKQSSPARQELSRSSQKKRTPREKLVVPENVIDCENLEPAIEYVRHVTQQISPIQPFPGTSVGSYFSPSSSHGICSPGNCITRHEPETLPTKRKAGGKRTKSTVNSARESVEQSISNESTLNGRPSSSVESYFSPSSTQLNFERFNGICSPSNCITRQEPDTLPTKRRAGGKRTKSTVNSTPESGEQSISNESTLNGRPSRKCRPKSLKEPSTRSLDDLGFYI